MKYLVIFHIATNLLSDEWSARKEDSRITFMDCDKSDEEIEFGVRLQEVRLEVEARSLKEAVRRAFKLIMWAMDVVCAYFGCKMYLPRGEHFIQIVIKGNQKGKTERDALIYYEVGYYREFSIIGKRLAKTKIRKIIRSDQPKIMRIAVGHFRYGAVSRFVASSIQHINSSLEALVGRKKQRQVNTQGKAESYYVTDYAQLDWSDDDMSLLKKVVKDTKHGRQTISGSEEDMVKIVNKLIPEVSKRIRKRFFDVETEAPFFKSWYNSSQVSTGFTTKSPNDLFPPDIPRLVSSRDASERLKNYSLEAL